MPVSPSQIVFYGPDGNRIKDNSIGNLFPSVPAKARTDYALVEVRNTHPTLSLTSAVAWRTATAGATVSIATTTNPDANLSALSYSTPSTRATGITLANITPGGSIYIAVRRVVGTTTASPQTVRLYVGGSSLV